MVVGVSMAAREQVTYGLECSKCGQKGEVHCTENDHPYMTSVDIAVKRVTGDFDVTKHSDSDLAVTCRHCHTKYVF